MLKALIRIYSVNAMYTLIPMTVLRMNRYDTDWIIFFYTIVYFK